MAYKDPERTNTEANPSVPPARYVAAALLVLGLALAVLSVLAPHADRGTPLNATASNHRETADEVMFGP